MGKTLRWYRELCDSSFFHFVKICGGAVGQGGIISPIIHKPLCDNFQDLSEKRKGYFMPRNWLKSTVFTEWGTIWLYLQNPNIRILIASENERNAKRFQFFIERQLLYNETLRGLYPDRLDAITPAYKRSTRWSSEEMYLPGSSRTGGKEATITSIGIKGAAQSGHYDIVLIDDPVGKKHIESPAELEKVLAWQDNCYELLDNPNFLEPESSIVQIVCTFWGPGDYGCYVVENFPEFKFFVVPALKYSEVKDTENIKYIQDPSANDMTSNWEDAPKGRSKTAYYINMMANPQKQQIFWAQHMNMPQKAGGLQKFDIAWIKEYRWGDKTINEWDETERIITCLDDGEEFIYRTIPKWGYIDPGGYAETRMVKRGSKLAIVIGGQPQSSVKKFMFYTWAGLLRDPGVFMDTLFAAHLEYRPMYWKIENIGSQDYIYKDIKAEAKIRKIPLRIMTMPVSPKKDDKNIDIAGLINPMANGEYYLHNSMTEAKAQIQNFPAGLANDILDMMAKMHKYQFKRTPADEIRDMMKMRKREFMQRHRSDVSEVTGY